MSSTRGLASRADVGPISGWVAKPTPVNFLKLESTDGKGTVHVKSIGLGGGGGRVFRVIMYHSPQPEETEAQFVGETMVESVVEIRGAVRDLEGELHGWEPADLEGDVPAHPGSVDRVGPPPEKIGGLDELVDRMAEAVTVEDWSYLLNDYIQWGNNTKVAASVGIFNLSSAHDCVNRGTERCQVGPNECYAVRDERSYDWAWQYFRRQEYLWDCLDADTFAEAVKAIVERKHSAPRAFKFNQSGDFRHQGDVVKVDRIAEQLAEIDLPVFTYSASSHLDWSAAEHFTVNRSDPNVEYGDRRYQVVRTSGMVPEDAIHCPFDRAKQAGEPLEERPKCGECMACVRPDGPDVAVTMQRRGR